MKAFRKALPQRPAAPLPPSPSIGATKPAPPAKTSPKPPVVSAAMTSSSNKCVECEKDQAVKYCQQCDAHLCSGCDRTVHASRVASAHVRVDVNAGALASSSSSLVAKVQVDKATAAKWAAEAYTRLEEIKSLEADLSSCEQAAKEALDKYFDELGRAVTNRKQELVAELVAWKSDRQAAMTELKQKAAQVAEGRQSGPVPPLERGQGIAFIPGSEGGTAIRSSGKWFQGPLGSGGEMKPPARDYASIQGPKYILGYGRGDAPGHNITPCDIAVHPGTGEIYQVDLGNHRVQVWSSDGDHIRTFGRDEESSKSMHFPKAITFDLDGNLAVADGRDRVTVWTTDGELLRRVEGTPAMEKGVETITGLTLQAGTGNYVVVDSRNRRVQIWRPDGAFVSSFSGDIKDPRDIAVDPFTGNFLIADFYGHKVTVWSPKGQFIRDFRGTLRGDKEPFKPSSVDVDAAGNILVVDQGNHRVQVWSREFELLCAFGTPGYQQPDHLWDPNFVTVAPNGDVIVSVCASNRCLVF